MHTRWPAGGAEALAFELQGAASVAEGPGPGRNWGPSEPGGAAGPAQALSEGGTTLWGVEFERRKAENGPDPLEFPRIFCDFVANGRE